MGDAYPTNFELEIDRDNLRKYLRAKWFLSWLGSVAFLMGASYSGKVIHLVEKGRLDGAAKFVSLCGQEIVLCLLGAAALSTVLYFLLSHHLAKKQAETLRVTVEGAYLRVRQSGYVTETDRKTRFRAIADYAISQGPLARKYGVMTLQMTMIGGDPQTRILRITGLKDGPRARDMLAAIGSGDKD